MQVDSVEGLANTDQVATKTDLAELESRLTLRMVAICGVFSGVIIAAVGLMMKL